MRRLCALLLATVMVLVSTVSANVIQHTLVLTVQSLVIWAVPAMERALRANANATAVTAETLARNTPATRPSVRASVLVVPARVPTTAQEPALAHQTASVHAALTHLAAIAAGSSVPKPAL